WGGGWMWSAGLLAFVAALIAVFVLMKKNVNSTNLPDHTTQQTKSNISPKQLKEEPPDTFSKRDGEPSPSPASTGRSIVPGTGRVDSTALVPLAGQLLPDSAQPALVVVPPPPLQDSISKPKPKKRGVPNITDADYRIVPSKRDST
ncbi:MAG: hypothetical protein M3Q06_14370, partial [Bacteroidota bacterium]|nr:hypothetical protein [Bacteroidota bacterium]